MQFYINFNRNSLEKDFTIDDQYCLTDFGNMFLFGLLNKENPLKSIGLTSMIKFW